LMRRRRAKRDGNPVDAAPAREARREPNTNAIGRSGRLQGWASRFSRPDL
jgi:hypothetical protein